MKITEQISKEINVNPRILNIVINLLEDGGTVPFIARYRKELTGGMDEVILFQIESLLGKFKELNKRKAAIISSLEKLDVFTPELNDKILNVETLPELEDIYLPYKVKRKTRGAKARELGLEPLGMKILKGESLGKPSPDMLIGAKDIIAEIINEDINIRHRLREIYKHSAILTCKVVKSKISEAENFRNFFDYSEKITKIPSHRFLAILRGSSLGFLRFHIEPDRDYAISKIKQKYSKGNNKKLIDEAIEDSYKRLLFPSLETEIKTQYKHLAHEKAIDIFKSNLRDLLLASPLGEKRVLAIDPGIRTGSKVVVLDGNGEFIENTVIKPLAPHNREEEASAIIKNLCAKYKIEVLGIGNGTGGRETEAFCKKLCLNIPIIMVNESGASIYSASLCGREEFPNLDITVRGAISIGRRLIDPLAELVKIDPKAIGVGQYQHDVDQKLLKQSLTNVVISSVGAVGVELNTASKELLSFVPGLNKNIANNIIEYRRCNGDFKTRNDLTKVKGLGKKVFEQAAGFLRIQNSKILLDRSGIHPESYHIVTKMANNLNIPQNELLNNFEFHENIDINKYITPSIGLPTLKDILLELAKPGRDPRAKFEVFEFDPEINTLGDLKVGISIPGIITNVTGFGAFVDIGVHQDGLVHISKLSKSFISDPLDVVKPGQKVTVTVLECNIERKRISLSMV